MVTSNTSALQALLLDLGGVLLSDDNSPQRQRWLDRIGREDREFATWLWSTQAALAALRGELPPGKFWRRIGAELGLSPAESRAMARDYFAGTRVNERPVLLARLARLHGLRVGLLSNAYGSLDGLLARFGVADLFDDVVNSSVVHLNKPEPAIYHLACARLGVPPQRALFIDDRPENVEGGRGAGLQALLYVGDEMIAEAARRLGLPWELPPQC